MKQNVSQIDGGIIRNVDVSVKNIIFVLVQIFVKMENILQVLCMIP